MSNHIPTSSAELNCLCGAISEPGSLLLADQFPIEVGICNCDNCRYATGALCGSSVQLKSAPSPAALSACRAYESSKGSIRYFCQTCGTKTFIHVSDHALWFALSGIVERSDADADVDTTRVVRAGFVSHTVDGGLVRRLREVALAASPEAALQRDYANFLCFAEGRSSGKGVVLTEADSIWNNTATRQDDYNLARQEKKTQLSCHCQGTQFYIIRPDASKQYPARVEETWLKDNRTKYLARVCTCRWCRLASSHPVQPWAYVMPENILNSAGEPINFSWGRGAESEILPGVQVYVSSEGCRRCFCKTCGATVFWEDRSRSDVIDVSVGLFHSKQGALAEDWLSWDWPQASGWESCRDKTFVASVMESSGP